MEQAHRFSFSSSTTGIVVKQDKSPIFKYPFSVTSIAKNIALTRSADWAAFSSHDIPSDVTVKACGVPFALHKFPLVSRSGWIRKLVADEATDSKLSRICLHDIPGGAEAFDLAAKFCYGIQFDINDTNVAMLRCAAEYLEMSEDYGERNLISQTEEYLMDLGNADLSSSVKVLQSCKDLLPMAEKLHIVSRCVEAAATRIRKEEIASSLPGSDGVMHRNEILNPNNIAHKCNPTRWWAEELCVLWIDFYQEVLSALRARGLRHDRLGDAILLYSQKALQGLIRKPFPIVQTKYDVHDSSTTAGMEHEQRILVETIVHLLPQERNTVSVSFLFGLVRAAIYLDTTVACRLDLERRIGLQLEQAYLDDLLIPSFSYANNTLFDVDTVHRIVIHFLDQDGNGSFRDPLVTHKIDFGGSASPSSVMKVARLLDCYLAEIAPDSNLIVGKFVGLAELMPEYARVLDDGLYRAIDIYLKAHSSLNELERKKICSLMNCQKLSQEACAHAAQNDRLPIQVIVQVLYFEQTRLRNALRVSIAGAGGAGAYMECITEEEADQLSQRLMSSSGTVSGAVSPREDYAAMRKENMELKLEVGRMRRRITEMEMESEQRNEKKEKALSSSSSSSSKTKFLQTLSRKLGKLNPFQQRRNNDNNNNNNNPWSSSSKPRTARRRRHSLS